MIKRFKCKIEKVDLKVVLDIQLEIKAARSFLVDSEAKMKLFWKKLSKTYEFTEGLHVTIDHKSKTITEILPDDEDD